MRPRYHCLHFQTLHAIYSQFSSLTSCYSRERPNPEWSFKNGRVIRIKIVLSVDKGWVWRCRICSEGQWYLRRTLSKAHAHFVWPLTFLCKYSADLTYIRIFWTFCTVLVRSVLAFHLGMFKQTLIWEQTENTASSIAAASWCDSLHLRLASLSFARCFLICFFCHNNGMSKSNGETNERTTAKRAS